MRDDGPIAQRQQGQDLSLVRSIAFAAKGFLLLGLLVLLPYGVEAQWLGKLLGAVEQAGMRGVARQGLGALDRVAAHIKLLPPKAGGAVLAAEAIGEGQWRFVNKAGETLTAGTPEELKRVVPLLVPDAKPDARLALYVTENSVFAQRGALKELPRGTELHVLVDGTSYRLLRRGEGGAGERLFAEVRPSLVVELGDQRPFREAIWQLARPLNKADIRVVAFEPGAQPRLPPAPRLDPASKRALIDTIDPGSLAAALGSVRGQTVLVTGRVDGRLLYFKPASGPERSLILGDLFKAAEDADVDLVVLHAASTPRQPGGRNWLWQKVEVKGLDAALQHARVADFYNALATPGTRLAVAARPAGPLRTVLEIGPAADLPRPAASRPIGDILADAVSDLTGRVIATGVQANVSSAERRQELDWRLIPGIPSALQIGYCALVVLGLLGLPAARAWWCRIWPPEDRSEYAGETGYWAARLIRGGVFAALFMPLAAPLSVLWSLARNVWEIVAAPVRWWRRLAGKLRRTGTAGDHGGRVPSAPLGAERTPPAPDSGSLGNYRPSR